MSTPNLLPIRTLERLAVILVRQSTEKQAKQNMGSGLMQLGQVELAQSFGFPEPNIVIEDLRGESGRRGANRVKFQRIVEQVAHDVVGMVLVARGDRLGRNLVDSAEFLEAAADTRTLICISGRIYDPGAANDRMMLGMIAQFAEYENDARTLWMVQARWKLAQGLAFRIALPSGLVWADPLDPDYRRRLQLAGLSEWLDSIESDHAAVKHEGQNLRILPFPDGDLVRACRLVIQWIIELRDLTLVVERILSPDAINHGWPQPGRIPVQRSRSFSRDASVEWVRLELQPMRRYLRGWLSSPALYSIYAYSSPAIEKAAEVGSNIRATISRRNAFRGFAPPEDFGTVGSLNSVADSL